MAGDTLLVDQEQQRVAVAIEPQFLQVLHLAGGLALAPQRLPRARPIAGAPFRERKPHRLAIHPGEHQDFAGIVLLRDRGYEPVRAELDRVQRAVDRVAHESLLAVRPSPAGRRKSLSLLDSGIRLAPL